jgi:hypothetical protein
MLQSENSSGCQTEDFKAALVSHTFIITPDSSTLDVSIDGDVVSWVCLDCASITSDTVYTISLSTELAERGRHSTFYNAVSYSISITLKSGSSESIACLAADYKGANKEDYLISRDGVNFAYESGEWPIVMGMGDQVEILCPSVKSDSSLDCTGFVTCSIGLDTTYFGYSLDSDGDGSNDAIYDGIFED